MNEKSSPNFDGTIKTYIPSFPLRNIVMHYEWAVFDHNTHVQSFNIFPSFGTGIGFYFWKDETLKVNSKFLFNESLPRTLIFSPLTSPITATNFKVFDMLRVVFHPGMMNSLFNRTPMSEFCDFMIDARVDLNRDLKEVYDRMLETDFPSEKIFLLNNYLLRKLRGQSIRPSIYNYLEKAFKKKSKSSTKVQEVSDELGISRQHLTRLSKNQLGYSPKETFNIMRFNRSQYYFHQRKPFTIAQAAIELGYFDQAHLTNEFRRYGDTTPKKYLIGLEAMEVYGQEYDFVHSGMVGSGGAKS